MRIGAVIVNFESAEQTRRVAREALTHIGVASSDLIIVENGSGEADRFSDLDCRVVINEKNLGFAAGVNSGARSLDLDNLHAFFLLNPDIFISEGEWGQWVHRLRAPVAAIGPLIRDETGNIQKSWYDTLRPERIFLEALGIHRWVPKVAPSMHHKPRSVGAVQGSCMLISSEAWKTVGEFDEKFFLYHEEVDWCLRAKERGLLVRYEPAGEVLHEKGREVPPGREPLYYEGAVYLTEKHFGAPAADRVRRQIRQAARWGARFSNSDERREGLLKTVESL